MKPEEIHNLRTRLGMSLRQFAEAIGLRGSARERTIRRWQSGKKIPTEEMIKRMKGLENGKR